jgi:predicted O-methyltransferase YrrM
MAKKWWNRSTAEELKPIPWLHPVVIAYFESILQPDFEVLEHGSGGSTLWLAERVKSVLSVENEAEWMERVEAEAPENVRLMLWEKDILPKFSSKKCDLLFIDGEPVTNRQLYLEAAEQLVKPGGWVVLDNANRPEYARQVEIFSKKAQLVKRIDGNEPGTLYFVTEFYRMKGKEDEDRPEPVEE